MISERRTPNLCRATPTPPLVHSASRRCLRLKEMLKQKLVDSGWREDLKSYTMGAPPFNCCPHDMLLVLRPFTALRRSHPNQGR